MRHEYGQMQAQTSFEALCGILGALCKDPDFDGVSWTIERESEVRFEAIVSASMSLTNTQNAESGPVPFLICLQVVAANPRSSYSVTVRLVSEDGSADTAEEAFFRLRDLFREEGPDVAAYRKYIYTSLLRLNAAIYFARNLMLD